MSVLASEGDYKCQVSGEAPRFAIEAQTKRLRVASRLASSFSTQLFKNDGISSQGVTFPGWSIINLSTI